MFIGCCLQEQEKRSHPCIHCALLTGEEVIGTLEFLCKHQVGAAVPKQGGLLLI